MTDSLPLRIFLASPGGLENERKVIEQCVIEHNGRVEATDSNSFKIVDWNQVRATARRPQEAINELIYECHYMVVLFKDTWGSEPGSPWGFTSGTEEELFTGLLELGQADRPMRDVWVAFIDHPAPSPKVNVLKQQITSNHSMLYESISGTSDLKDKISDRFKSWANPASSKKIPRHIELLSSSGKEVLKAAKLRRDGEQLINLGQTETGRISLHEAAVLGGPEEKLAYAKFLARHGQLEDAKMQLEKTMKLITQGSYPLYSPLAAEVFTDNAEISRKLGKPQDAIGELMHALNLLTGNDSYVEKVTCRIYDALGLAFQNAGDVDSAREYFRKAYKIRDNNRSELERQQSLLNLARIELYDGNLELADKLANEVMAYLEREPPTAMYANSYVLGAQVRLAQGRAIEATTYAKKALDVNRRLANRIGEAISLYLLSQCHRDSGMKEDAIKVADECLSLNTSMNNEHGMRQAKEIIDQLKK